MQIFPSEHNISTSEEITLNHIPLAYFQKVEKNIIPSINIDPSFYRLCLVTVTSIVVVLPAIYVVGLSANDREYVKKLLGKRGLKKV